MNLCVHDPMYVGELGKAAHTLRLRSCCDKETLASRHYLLDYLLMWIWSTRASRNITTTGRERSQNAVDRIHNVFEVRGNCILCFRLATYANTLNPACSLLKTLETTSTSPHRLRPRYSNRQASSKHSKLPPAHRLSPHESNYPPPPRLHF